MGLGYPYSHPLLALPGYPFLPTQVTQALVPLLGLLWLWVWCFLCTPAENHSTTHTPRQIVYPRFVICSVAVPTAHAVGKRVIIAACFEELHTYSVVISVLRIVATPPKRLLVAAVATIIQLLCRLGWNDMRLRLHWPRGGLYGIGRLTSSYLLQRRRCLKAYFVRSTDNISPFPS